MDTETGVIQWLDTVTLPTNEFVRRYYNPQKQQSCHSCPFYGKNHACPPDGAEAKDLLLSFPFIHLFAARHYTARPITSGKEMHDAFAQGRIVFDAHLLACEANSECSMALIPCSCTRCERCARVDHEACRYPDKLRKSLDALSVEVSRIADEVFSLEIQWYKEKPSEYVTMIGGILSMQPAITA